MWQCHRIIEMLLILRWRRRRSLDPLDLVVFTKPPQYRLMDTLPYACLHPFV
jgi:hypothetical protein